MRTGAAAGHLGYYHEAVCYDSDEHLLDVVVPFLLGGVAAGEPTLVSFGARSAALLRSALPAHSGVVFLAGGDVYSRPTAAIRSYQELLASHVAAGAQQIRIVGELPRTAVGATWDWWARYESAINHAYDEFPLWSLCAYDTRTTPTAVLADVARTHPRFALPGDRHVPSPTYTEPRSFLAEDQAMVPDPLQQGPPVCELTDPSPAQARRAVYAANHDDLTDDDLEDLVVAVSETVTNALRHGRPPVLFRIWAGAGRVVVVVSDGGRGTTDPFAGLLPAGNGSAGGLGLWITYQSCNHVGLSHAPGGFTVRLTAGTPHLGIATTASR